jgi:nicotinate-nucleotide adenylyltransferase
MPTGCTHSLPVAAALEALARSSLGEARYLHSRRVADLAAELCSRWGEEPERGCLAGLGHDLARERPPAEILALARRDGSGVSPLERDHPLVMHGRAAAVIMQESGVSDQAVLQAVRDHVCGRPSMGTLSRILFAADYLEEGRDFHEEEARQRLLALPLDRMVLAVVEAKIRYVGPPSVAAASLALYEELKRHAG